MIWQDLMFAVALYPVHRKFLESVRKEVQHQVSFFLFVNLFIYLFIYFSFEE